MAMILAMLWLSQVITYLTMGKLPDLIVQAQTPTNFVFVLDLGVVVPLSVFAAILLLQDKAWGYALAGAMLLKSATMGLALVSMTIFAINAGQPIDIGLAAFWLALAVGGLAMSAWFFASCRGTP
jgi:hypothetical protein